ncbi:MAG TPA: PAS domain-containing protein [Cyclobacteriaceae bacterium]|jgi:PAS domain S-box-containing protein|nr:PAS domain-containing protein [Cyclobacteriaceae bacterium]
MKGVPFSVFKKAHVEKLKTDLSLKDQAIEAATQFVKEIEKGNLDFQYQLSNQDDNLASSLVSMRDQMKNFAAEERQRNWATEGLAKFVEILRSKGNSFTELSDNIINHLVKYMGANQGALYLVNDDDPQDTFLEMVSCFAYERKKHLHKRIEIGSGIVGQVILEKTTTYMTAIPKDYIKITSGLGASLPRNLLIVPLKLNDVVFGVVELAAFETIKPYQIEFVEKLGESIASTISAVKIAERTQLLLEETQQKTEDMKSQEEEMRQSMEELSATQEEMQRVLTEVQSKEGYLNELINATDDLIYTVDKAYKLVSWNKAFAKTLEQFGLVLEKGSNTLEWYGSDDEKKKQMDLYDRALQGETFELTTQADNKGTLVYFLNIYAPLRNINKEIFSVAVFGKNITEMTIARQQSDKLMKDAQNQTEELKAQEEELRQNMEELSATQEEMNRILQEVQDQERYMKDMINSTKDSILTVDREYKIVNFNKALVASYSGLGITVEKGLDMRKIFSAEEWPKFQQHYDRAFSGEAFEITEHYHSHGFDAYYAINYSPLRNDKGEIIAAAVFAKDTTQLMKASKAATELQLYYNDVIEGMVDCVLTIDADYKIVVANSAFKKVFSGYGLSVEPGSDLLAMAKGDPKKEAEFKKPYVRAFAGEHVEEPHRHHFDLDFQVSYNPLKNNAGEVVGVSLIARDITQRLQLQKQTEELLLESQQQSEELKAQEEELRQNMEELSATQEEMTRQMTEINRVKSQLEVRESIFGYTTILSEADLHGTITLVNDKLCEVSKYSREELIGKPHNVFRHPDMPQELFKIFWQTIKKGEVFKGIIKNKAKDGSHYWVDASIVPVKDETGKIVKYVGARYHIADDEIALMMYNKQAKKLKLPTLKVDSLELA